jgi:RND superfamily putative drug exporter
VWLVGPTAITADLAALAPADLERLALWITGGVFLLLVLLLRSVTASLAVTAFILLSYLAALGALALLVAQGVWPGLDWKTPFFLFVLLVAIGADYGVFVLGRAREEARALPYAAALARALEATGPVVTSCGLVLAGTFATLLLSRLAFLEQVGVGITVGVLIDTCIVRPFLLPAAALLLARGEGGVTHVVPR